MENPEIVREFIQTIQQAVEAGSFVKLTLSKPSNKGNELNNIYARLVDLKGQLHWGLTLRYATKDITKNYSLEEGLEKFKAWLGNEFLNADLFSTDSNISIKYNKKRKARLLRQAPSHVAPTSTQHNVEKNRLISAQDNLYLKALGVSSKEGKVLKAGQRKFRQINKYIEIIDSLLRQNPLSEKPHIVDMGSGKGYLTFALYDYLTHQINLKPSITGIELRKNLVVLCNDLAQQCGYQELQFLAKDIHDYKPEKIDMLIALHACDIATDIAIAKGIKANASIIVVAPCCHKQIRKQMNCNTDLQAILQHGILEERQAELVTDGIRALLLEAHGYKTKVFEFISTEHTSKNLMITAIKGRKKTDALAKVKAIKAQFGIEYHYLEKLLEEKVN